MNYVGSLSLFCNKSPLWMGQLDNLCLSTGRFFSFFKPQEPGFQIPPPCSTLSQITNDALFKQLECDKFIEMKDKVNNLPKTKRLKAIFDMVYDLISKKQFLDAEKILSTVPPAKAKRNDPRLGDSLRMISEDMAGSGMFSEAERVANKLINFPAMQDLAFQELSIQLSASKFFVESERIAIKISDLQTRKEALKVIFSDVQHVVNDFLQNHQLADIERFVHTELQGSIGLCSGVLQSVVKNLVAAQRFSEAICITNTISDEKQRSFALGDVVTGLVNVGRFVDAETIANTISDENQRSFSLQNVCSGLADACLFVDAERVRNKIYFEDIRDMLFDYIEKRRESVVIPDCLSQKCSDVPKENVHSRSLQACEIIQGVNGEWSGLQNFLRFNKEDPRKKFLYVTMSPSRDYNRACDPRWNSNSRLKFFV